MMQQQQQLPHQPPQQPPQHTPAPTPEPKKEPTLFQTLDFPALGTDEATLEKQRNLARKNAAITSSTPRTTSKPPPPRRITFSNPSPNAEPILATSIPSKSMTSRDLCHVLHSMMRPLLSFTSVVDAYNADYYRWSFDDLKSRILLMLGGGGPSPKVKTTNLPNPVWNETKIKAREMEQNFRTSVEKRASDWSKEKHILGKVVKVNVKRPRALLSTTALTASLHKDDEESKSETEYDDRAFLWAARLAIDKGYLAYLNLVELRRLLQSRPGDTFMLENEQKREELLEDVN